MVFNADALWHSFATRHTLTDSQLQQFMAYYELLTKQNAVMNLTAIETLDKVISHHFDDALALDKAVDVHQVTSIADVGSGAGFPGIPLKIKYPHLHIYLIEVTLKKVEFLQQVINTLNLDNVETVPLDWRTFLRTTTYSIDIFCARASLAPAELLRMFAPSCFYKKNSLVYWASKKWAATSQEQLFITQQVTYVLTGHIERRLIVFKNYSYTSEKKA